MEGLRFKVVKLLSFVMLLSFSDLCLGVGFSQTQSQPQAEAAPAVQAMEDQREQVARLAAEIEKVKQQQQIILEEIARTKKFLR